MTDQTLRQSTRGAVCHQPAAGRLFQVPADGEFAVFTSPDCTSPRPHLQAQQLENPTQPIDLKSPYFGSVWRKEQRNQSGSDDS